MAPEEGLAALGAWPEAGGIRFRVWSGAAERVHLCLFDEADRESDRLEMTRGDDGIFDLHLPGLEAGIRYGYRADGPYDPAQGLWFDPDKLLLDPYCWEIDRPYRYDRRLGATRGEGVDTAPLMPKARAIVPPPALPAQKPRLRPGGFIYELSVRSLTMRHPDVPAHLRGTIGALAHPAVLAHLTELGVDAVELMPVTAWMDERHLPPLGLTNAWGYNPVTFMALDPKLAPGGWAELQAAVSALHGAGIAVILDLVFNHTAESDALGTTLSLRGLDNRAYFRHAGEPLQLVNDTGCGNTVDCEHPVVRRMVIDALRRFVNHAGIDGFRFDLAPVLGRTDQGFTPDAPLLREMLAEPDLSDRIMIAEPWDIGPGGYRLGEFPAPFLEWNDQFRDDVRRFWRGDGSVAPLATRLAGSSDLFGAGSGLTRSVNFLAAHDGMTLADITAYTHKHNEANGESNRDGHDENLSWNHGVEGETDSSEIADRRRRDVKAMLATLFVSRGTVMLTAGDEIGRTQRGNNNAYAMDNHVAWLDWAGRDEEIEQLARALAQLRRRFPILAETRLLSGDAVGSRPPDVEWLNEAGETMTVEQWEDGARRSLVMVLGSDDGERLAVLINGSWADMTFRLPQRDGTRWELVLNSDRATADGSSIDVGARTVAIAGQR